jgi:hypothetical protein
VPQLWAHDHSHGTVFPLRDEGGVMRTALIFIFGVFGSMLINAGITWGVQWCCKAAWGVEPPFWPIFGLVFLAGLVLNGRR